MPPQKPTRVSNCSTPKAERTGFSVRGLQSAGVGLRLEDKSNRQKVCATQSMLSFLP